MEQELWMNRRHNWHRWHGGGHSRWHFPASPLPPWQVAQLAQQWACHFQAAPLHPLAGGTGVTAVGVAFSSSSSPPPDRWHRWHSSWRGIFHQHLSPPGRWHSWHSSRGGIFKQHLSPLAGGTAVGVAFSSSTWQGHRFLSNLSEY